MWDSSVQGSTLETDSGVTTDADHSTPVEVIQWVKANSLSRSKTNACFPEVTEEPYQTIRDDIQKNGQLNPVLVHGHEVVDGWPDALGYSKRFIPVED